MPVSGSGEGMTMRHGVALFATALMLIALAGPAHAGTYEDDLLTRINEYRAAQDLKPLIMRSAYVALAREQSRAMRAAGRLSHDGFKGRFKKAHRNGANGCVENVGWNYPTPQALLEGWQQSPGHDRNLLDPAISGVGIAKVGPYITYFACYYHTNTFSGGNHV